MRHRSNLLEIITFLKVLEVFTQAEANMGAAIVKLKFNFNGRLDGELQAEELKQTAAVDTINKNMKQSLQGYYHTLNVNIKKKIIMSTFYHYPQKNIFIVTSQLKAG